MKTRTITAIAMMLAIIIILGFIPPIPLGILPVPLVFQNLGIMLAGILLGAKRGTLTVFLFLVLVALGFPILSGGSGGLVVFAGVTVGYLVSWLFCATLIGLNQTNFLTTHNVIKQFLVIWLPGVLFVDIMGSIGLTLTTGMPLIQALLSNLVFIPGDTIKACVVVIVARRLLTLPFFKKLS
ncbi:biotin transporter BioY [Enterococcus bulliens]